MSEDILENDVVTVAVDINSKELSSMEEEEIIQGESLMMNNDVEDLHSMDDTWTLYRGEKRRKNERIDICITSSEKLPKQFALAKLFQKENICGITDIKYINAFKIRVSFEDVLCAEKLVSGTFVVDKGWKAYKTWEVGVTYGIIRNIDLDISDEELLSTIKSVNSCEILSVKRLNRRGPESEWIPTETIRICIKGSSRPEYIKLMNLRVKLEPFLLPVTQCSRCWRFGHPRKFCPSIKIVCPKCGQDHGNCDTTSFKCVNCKQSHMALAKTCPVYIKEKKIRSLMSDFNCTYQRALNMYVPPFSPGPNVQHETTIRSNVNKVTVVSQPLVPSGVRSYAGAAANTNDNTNTSSNTRTRPPKRKHQNSSEQITFDLNSSVAESDTELNVEANATTGCGGRALTEVSGASRRRRRGRPRHRQRSTTAGANPDDADDISTCSSDVLISDNEFSRYTEPTPDNSESFKSLLNKINKLLFSKRYNWDEKIKTVVSIFVKWCVSTFSQSISNMSLFKNMFDMFLNFNNGEHHD